MKRLFTLLLLLAASLPALAIDCSMPPSPCAHLRGVNRAHWDQDGSGIALTGATAERINLNFARDPQANLDLVNAQIVAHGMVPIVSNWRATCNSSPAALFAIVDTWVDQAKTWTKLDGLVNIANEWGPPDSTVWRDSYIAAVGRLRAAGYTGTLVVDSGGCAQDPQDILKYGKALIAADPLHNVLFDLHVYGNFHFPATLAWQTDYARSMAALKASGLPIIMGEFGPGKGIGPSPTTIPPERVIADAEANGWGWLAWAWDDNNLPGCKSSDGWFSMTRACGKYATDDDLTDFGRVITQHFKAGG